MSLQSGNSPTDTGSGNQNGTVSNQERNNNRGTSGSRGPSHRNNSNNETLNFDDNYAAILQNLASDNAQAMSQNFGNINAKNSLLSIFSKDDRNKGQGSNDEYDGGPNIANDNNNVSSAAGSGLDKQNIDVLLKHYQKLLNRSGSPNNSGGQRTLDEADNQRDTNKSTITERPCDHCRRRQKKCVMVPDLTSCIHCETKGIKCAFSELPNHINRFTVAETDQTRSKHPRSEEYDNLETLLKKAKSSNNENVVQYYSELLQNMNDSGSTPHPLHYGPAQNSLSPPRVPSNPSLINMLQFNQRGLSQMKQSPSPPGQFPRSSFYVGATSAYDVNLVNHVQLDHIDQVQLLPTVALRKVAPNVQFILRDNFDQQLYAKQEQEIDMAERLVYPHGEVLIDIFFKFVHPYYPILHERIFMEKYSRSYRELTAPLLASIYSLALQWWDFHPKLIGFPKPDVTNQLNDIALRNFFEMIERPKLSMVQTGLLILSCRSECTNNWVLNSTVVALAEELGLGIDCHDWKLPRWERGLRRRLAWAVWAQDKWTASIESRHSNLILGRNWLVKMLTEEDFPADSPVINSSRQQENATNMANPLGNISLYDMSPTNDDFVDGTLMFKQLVSLSVILGEIMETFYTEGAVQLTTKIEQVLKLAKPLQLKLREWYHSLPPQLSMNKFVPRKFNANATLTLAYFAVEITLHRKIISTLGQDTPKELVHVCRTAARTRLVAAIEFVRDLKNEHINAFWYTCSTGNLMLIGTFAALLYVTARTKDEAIVFRDCLRNYIWVLRVGSKSFEKAANALNRIHMLLTQIPGLLTDEQPKEPTSHSPTLPLRQWKAEPEQPSPDFNQLRNLPPELLHSLTSMRGNTPNISSNRDSNHSFSPGYSSSSRNESKNQTYNGINAKNGLTNSSEGNTSRGSPSDSEAPAGPKPVATGNEVTNADLTRQEGRPENQDRKVLESFAPATQSNQSNPITPQSVGNVVKDATPIADSDHESGTGKNTERPIDKVSTISPSSVGDKKQPGDNMDSSKTTSSSNAKNNEVGRSRDNYEAASEND